MVPDALGELRILDFPVGVGRAARGDPQFFCGIIVPSTASSGVRVGFGGFVPRVFVFTGFVEIGVVLVEGPFDDVPDDVVESPWVGLFLADFLVLAAAVFRPPSVVADFGVIVAPEELALGSCAGGVLPFGFCGEAVEVAGFGGQPLAVLIGCVLGHGNGGETVFAHPEAHFHIGLGGVGDGVGHFVEVGVELLGGTDATFLVEVHEELELVPSHLAGPHPEGRDFDLPLRSFVLIASIFTVGASHEEASAGDGDEVEGHIGTGNAFRVRLHFLFADGFGVSRDAFVDGGDEFGFIDGLDLLDFAGDEFEVIGPLGAFENPLFDEVGFFFGKRAALFLGGHEEVVVRVEDHRGVDEAFVGLSGDERVAAFAAFKGLGFGVHSETAFGVPFAVAADAVLLEDGLDILHEVDCGGGGQDGCERDGECEGALGRFHGDESIR